MPASRTNCDASEAFSISVGYGWRRFLKNHSRRVGTACDSDLDDLSGSPEKVAMLSGSIFSSSAPMSLATQVDKVGLFVERSLCSPAISCCFIRPKMEMLPFKAKVIPRLCNTKKMSGREEERVVFSVSIFTIPFAIPLHSGCKKWLKKVVTI